MALYDLLVELRKHRFPRRRLYALANIQVRFDKTASRAILFSRHPGKTHFQRECNGVVLDTRNWTYLAKPPRDFLSTNTAAKRVDKALAKDKYDIFQVLDGTTCTIYQYASMWCISTKRGYDVSTYKWMGDKTYAEILYELLSANSAFVQTTGLELREGRLAFACLSNLYSYTVGFRHHNFHPFLADPRGIWNVQATELSTGTPVFSGLPHIPFRAIYSRKDILLLALACGLLLGDNVRVADLVPISKTSLEEAKKGEPLPQPVRSATEHGSLYNYGWFLRSREPEVYPDVLFESPLLRRIRYLVYKAPPKNIQLDERTRLEYHANQANLVDVDREDFLALFPQLWAHVGQLRE